MGSSVPVSWPLTLNPPLHIQGSAPSLSHTPCIFSLGCWRRAPGLSPATTMVLLLWSMENSLPDSLIHLSLKTQTPTVLCPPLRSLTSPWRVSPDSPQAQGAEGRSSSPTTYLESILCNPDSSQPRDGSTSLEAAVPLLAFQLLKSPFSY